MLPLIAGGMALSGLIGAADSPCGPRFVPVEDEPESDGPPETWETE